MACFLAKRDAPVAATLQRKSSGGINYKNYYKRKCSRELFCNNFGRDGICLSFVYQSLCFSLHTLILYLSLTPRKKTRMPKWGAVVHGFVSPQTSKTPPEPHWNLKWQPLSSTGGERGEVWQQTAKKSEADSPPPKSETGRIRFRRVRFQTPNSVSFLGLIEFGGANSVSSFQPIICVPKRTHRVSRRTHRVCRRTQWVLSSEKVLSKQYSARSLQNVKMSEKV